MRKYIILVLALAQLACGLTTLPTSTQPAPAVQNVTVDKKQVKISTETPRGCYGLVNAAKLNLRAKPDYNSPADGAGLADGEFVKIVGTVGDWYKVKTKDGREGYAKAEYISRPGCE